jgi:hypothetical protein
MIRPYRAKFKASKRQLKPKPSLQNSKLIRRLLGTSSLALLLLGFSFELYKAREIDIEISNTIEVVARRSNPCFSYQKLQDVSNLIVKKGLDQGNTDLIPDSSFYPSEGDKSNLTSWHNQIIESISIYEGLCNQLIKIEPRISNYDENEKSGEDLYQALKKANPNLNDKILTQDFTGPSRDADLNLVDEKGIAIIPANINLMPYLREFLIVRYLLGLILFCCYFGPTLRFLNDKNFFKFGVRLISKIAPWRI